MQVLAGSEPNEHGTWQYGRGGWCDGQEVSIGTRTRVAQRHAKLM